MTVEILPPTQVYIGAQGQLGSRFQQERERCQEWVLACASCWLQKQQALCITRNNDRHPAGCTSRRAFYYVRVIEIPTPRWTAYDAKYFHIEMPEGTAMEVTDRAYTSPIWYTPPN
jgi:hypothetical protein